MISDLYLPDKNDDRFCIITPDGQNGFQQYPEL